MFMAFSKDGAAVAKWKDLGAGGFQARNPITLKIFQWPEVRSWLQNMRDAGPKPTFKKELSCMRARFTYDVEGQTSLVGVVRKFGERDMAQVLAVCFDNSSKLRGPSQIALVLC
ncbi:hypothetical protein AVEN_34577-1 [Araneus ventricosus]|uniref:Uncharacterized protein n=1 Tax=Araneus ventricosus TaxID=182803 RepID=A0A4Y2AZT7_ARAVE|nr:hypothetical protein AVEN_34577-1 [Araneus ventricosus]